MSTADPHPPLVSVLMPFRDAERTLASAIASILGQSWKNLELLLVDDGSRDQSYRVASGFRDPRVRLYRGASSLGLPARLNELLDLCGGKYVARMDADDISFPSRLEQQVEFLERHPEVDLLGTSMLVFTKSGSAHGVVSLPPQHHRICARPWAGFPMAHPTWMGRASWFREHRYRADAVRCEDQELLLRAHSVSRYANLPHVLLGFREDHIPLRKFARSKWNHAKVFARYFFGKRQPLRAMAGVGLQILRLGLDAVGVISGLEYRMLRHRLEPVSPQLFIAWDEVWQRFGVASASERLAAPD